MRMLYVSRRALKLAGIYTLALALLITGAGLFLPEGEAALAEPGTEPFRAGPAESSMVSLAVNVDWGTEYMQDFLDILAEYEIPATFFLTGRWTDQEQDLAKSIAEAGHEIGNHGYSHTSPNASTIEEIVKDIKRTEEVIQKVTGVTTRLYAPPSGESEAHVVQAATEAGYHTILWSLDTVDWQRPAASVIVDRVLNNIHGGAIILAHPTASTLEALPTIIRELEAKGYHFVTVSENLGL